jgi:hypothetical protein
MLDFTVLAVTLIFIITLIVITLNCPFVLMFSSAS